MTVGAGSSDAVDLTVTSQFDPSTSTTVTMETSTYLVYLPVIVKVGDSGTPAFQPGVPILFTRRLPTIRHQSRQVPTMEKAHGVALLSSRGSLSGCFAPGSWLCPLTAKPRRFRPGHRLTTLAFLSCLVPLEYPLYHTPAGRSGQ